MTGVDRRVKRRAKIVWPYMTPGDLAGIAAVILVIAGFLLVTVVSPSIGWRTNYGFGPDWDCANPGKGGPICVKRAGPANKTN